MRLDQAIYGEKRGGHSLIKSTDGGRFSASITSRLDLPDTAPLGVDWSPFISGFAIGGCYVLARTFLDLNASRAGMVLSHALIAPLEEIARTSDLRPLFALLLREPRAPATLAPADAPPPAGAAPESDELVMVAEALVNRAGGIAVRLGVAGFEDLVAALWFRLWPEARAGFSFRLSFGPNDLVEVPPPSLVCTPTVLASRWIGRRIINAVPCAPLSRAASILLGSPATDGVLDFGREIGARLDRFSDLPLIERATALHESAALKFDEKVSALRLVERLSPDPSVGTAAKAGILADVVELLPSASAGDVLLLRNITASAFPSPSALWLRLTSWAAENSFLASQDATMLQLLADAMASNCAVPDWRGAVLGGLKEASERPAFAAAFWRWIPLDSKIVRALFAHLSPGPNTEARLAEAAPAGMRGEDADAVMDLALGRDWMRLHGAAASAGYEPSEAVHRHLSADPSSRRVDGIRAALRCAAPNQVLGIAIQLGDPRLVRTAAEEAAKMPRLLADINMASGVAQEIWAQSVALNPEAWCGPANPTAAFGAIIDAVIAGEPASAARLNALSASPLADLCDQPCRAEAWDFTGEPARTVLLRSTAAGWLQRSSTSVPFVPEPALQTVILDGGGLDRILSALVQTSVGAAVQIIAALSGYDERRFLYWLQGLADSRPYLPEPDAEAIGRLVLGRGWRGAVDRFVSLTWSGRTDVKAALRICHPMVNIVTRWSLGLAPVSPSEKWLVLAGIVSELYPHGPDDRELWDRAGGRSWELRSDGDGRTRWHAAIALMQRGGGPRVRNLLDEMAHDYPANTNIAYLARDRDFGEYS
ncbi:effector-associated domain EAD1-containing protein (plasmid) [Skermanella mucosa]|uniref:GAP1-N1 domain-containing protein n=1 Tax=Skermanella mucosa TaxID=1789672 RepID=UPI00192C0CEB|nr:effector-associated domain EAD1-containing protein [Skermanella mucosa]UEM24360.1 effector-associated domain EAD1-containing protein [Skermanella mucosa]